MKNICFDDGYHEYKINGDESRVIRVNPSDFGILARLNAAQEAMKDVTIENSPEGIAEFDRLAREQIDMVFGEGTAETVFGRINCASVANGKPVYINFLEAFAPIIKADVEAERKKSDANIKKYTSQVK